MKRTTIIILTAILPIMAIYAADWKVIESSRKNAPEWLGTITDDYITVDVERPSLSEAEKAASEELARRIITAVAINVTSDSKSGGSVNMEGDKSESSEYFSYNTELASARLPFMKGISLANALDTYWEKREDKKSKRQYVIMSVQYPLSRQELEEMQLQFIKLDSEKTKEFNDLKMGLNKVDSSQDIQQAIAKLKALQEYFFDKSRLAEAVGLEKSYRNLYKGLTLRTDIDNSRKEATVSVVLNGKPFKCTSQPTVTSNCANKIQVTHSDDGYDFIISYSDEDCLEGEDNYLDVSLRIEGARLNSKIYLPG